MMEPIDNDSNEDERPLLKAENKRGLVLGSVLAFLSSVLFTVCGLIIQRLSLNVSDVLVVRYTLQITIVTATIYFWRRRLEQQQQPAEDFKLESILHLNDVTKLLLLQGLLNGVCVMSEFMCVSNLPLGDASALIFSSPLPAMILANIFLGDSLKLYKGFCGVVLYIGVMCVVKPTFLFGQMTSEIPIKRWQMLIKIPKLAFIIN